MWRLVKAVFIFLSQQGWFIVLQFLRHFYLFFSNLVLSRYPRSSILSPHSTSFDCFPVDCSLPLSYTDCAGYHMGCTKMNSPHNKRNECCCCFSLLVSTLHAPTEFIPIADRRGPSASEHKIHRIPFHAASHASSSCFLFLDQCSLHR